MIIAGTVWSRFTGSSNRHMTECIPVHSALSTTYTYQVNRTNSCTIFTHAFYWYCSYIFCDVRAAQFRRTSSESYKWILDSVLCCTRMKNLSYVPCTKIVYAFRLCQSVRSSKLILHNSTRYQVPGTRYPCHS